MSEATINKPFYTEEEVKKKCQENPWLKIGGYDFQDDPLMELDYDYGLHTCQTIEELEKKFEDGNWSIRSAFAYNRLLFVNQVNGGDEWWTCYKHNDGRIEAFESITFRGMVGCGDTFKNYIEKLLKQKEEKALA